MVRVRQRRLAPRQTHQLVHFGKPIEHAPEWKMQKHAFHFCALALCAAPQKMCFACVFVPLCLPFRKGLKEARKRADAPHHIVQKESERGLKTSRNDLGENKLGDKP